MIEKPDHPIRELVGYFLRLGTLGFGGPVALVGQMERELVTERGWLTKDEMREVIAVCQSLPGPLAIQVGIFISYLRGGFWGAWAGGWAFILPNFLIVAALGRTLRAFRWPATGHRHLLWRKPRCDRTDPALVLPARKTGHGGRSAVGHRRRMLFGDRDPAGGGRAPLHCRRHARPALVWHTAAATPEHHHPPGRRSGGPDRQ